MDAEEIAAAFHEAYERLAPSFGYQTRKISAVPWNQVPEHNRALMIATCEEVVIPLLRRYEQALAQIEPLVAACEEEFVPDEDGGFGPFSDDEGVMSPDTPITFGMIRRARIALELAEGDERG